MKKTMESLLTLEVKDRNGKTVKKITKPLRSYVIAWLQLIECQIEIANVTIKDYAGVNQDTARGLMAINASVGDDTLGMVVGTGTTPVTNLDWTMETLIAHGAGAGQLNYGVQSKVTTAEVGANIDFLLVRTFTNGSGNTINVTEFGLVVSCDAHDFLCIHDVTTAVSVLNGQTLTVTYTLRTTV